VRVVDGDTIRARTDDGAVVRVRYIGVDTPEIAHPGATRPAGCFGREADRANRALLPEGEAVRLLFDADRRDRYGRLLAYVYRRRDGLFVNERLVRDGLARALEVAPNLRFARRFAALSREAERARRGLWGSC
jgi:micrococcal nuclease